MATPEIRIEKKILFPSRHAVKMVRVTVKDVSQQDFVVALAAHFKKSGKLRVPEWVDLVKTAKFKELSPYNQDWFYIRCASIIRHLYMRGGVGVKSFQKIYGGRKSRGTKPSHFCRGSSSIARKALQSLEAIKLVTKDEMGGRRITKDGQRDLDRIACQVAERSAKAKLQEAQIQA